MWGLDGKDESRGAQCRKACRGFEGLCIFASWMARTAHTNSTPLPVLFSSFIWVGWSGEIFRVSSRAGLSSPRSVQGCHFLLLFPFPQRVCTQEL